MTNEEALIVLDGMRMASLCDTNECKLDAYDSNNIACKMCDEEHDALVIAIAAVKKKHAVKCFMHELFHTVPIYSGFMGELVFKADDIFDILKSCEILCDEVNVDDK